MKKVLLLLMCLFFMLSFVGCSKKNPEPEVKPENVENAEDANKEEIEDGGDILDNGEVVSAAEENKEGNNKTDEAEPSKEAEQSPQPTAAPQIEEKDVLTYDENGNITRESAVLILQRYTAEQLGLSTGVSHQLLFDESGAVINQKKCHAIVAKVEGGDTEGVFYITYDGKEAYKYDLPNQKYIKLP